VGCNVHLDAYWALCVIDTKDKNADKYPGADYFDFSESQSIHSPKEIEEKYLHYLLIDTDHIC
jgi:hypothetical protein